MNMRKLSTTSKTGFTLAEGATHVDMLPINTKAGFTLAEGATHVETPPINAKAGFTLAEVLITLGIIGIVAAMTLPVLISNISATKNRSRFKKTISTLNQSVKLTSGKYDLDFAAATNLCTNQNETAENAFSFCAILNSTLAGGTFYANAGSIRPSNTNQKYYYNTVTRRTVGDARYYGGYVTADGVIVAINLDARQCMKNVGQELNSDFITKAKSYWYGGGAGLNNCRGFIDVNGPEPPNREVTCSDGPNKGKATNNPGKPCYVNMADTGDIFPVVFYNDVVAPATDAAAYVLNNAK